jgi:hypothetical protein
MDRFTPRGQSALYRRQLKVMLENPRGITLSKEKRGCTKTDPQGRCHACKETGCQTKLTGCGAANHQGMERTC